MVFPVINNSSSKKYMYEIINVLMNLWISINSNVNLPSTPITGTYNGFFDAKYSVVTNNFQLQKVEIQPGFPNLRILDNSAILINFNFQLLLYYSLCFQDPSVMGAALNILFDLAKNNVTAYKDLVPSFVSILKQITEHR